MAAEPHPWLMPLPRRIGVLALAVAWLAFEAWSSPAACGSGSPSAITVYGVWDFFLSGTYPMRGRHKPLAKRRWSPITAGAICCSGSRRRCARAARTRRTPTVDELAGVDEFQLARAGKGHGSSARDWLPAAVATEVLDIGSGLGGPARFLAASRRHSGSWASI